MSILRTYQELAFFFWVTSLLSVIFLVIGAICSKSKCDPSLHTAGWRWAAPKLHQTNHFSFFTHREGFQSSFLSKKNHTRQEKKWYLWFCNFYRENVCLTPLGVSINYNPHYSCKSKTSKITDQCLAHTSAERVEIFIRSIVSSKQEIHLVPV